MIRTPFAIAMSEPLYLEALAKKIERQMDGLTICLNVYYNAKNIKKYNKDEVLAWLRIVLTGHNDSGVSLVPTGLDSKSLDPIHVGEEHITVAFECKCDDCSPHGSVVLETFNKSEALTKPCRD